MRRTRGQRAVPRDGRGRLTDRGAGRPLTASAGQLTTTAPVAAGARRARGDEREPGEARAPWTVGLLPDEPAGLVVTRSAGKALLRATLSWPYPGSDPVLPALPEPLARVRHTVSRLEERNTLRLEGEATGTTRRELAATLDDALRAIAAHAALTEAVLEVSVVRRDEPRIACRRALEELASELSRAGFRVRFAPLELPVPAADVWVGTGGTGGQLEDFLHSHPLWKTP